MIREKDVQIGAVTETWGQEWNEVKLEIENFNMYKKDRIDGRKGGGTLIYVSRELKSYPCRELDNVPGDDSIWCWVKTNKKARILVGCIYRSCSSTPANDELLMNKIIKAQDIAGTNRVLLMGDFNVPEINWPENDANGTENSLPYRFFECIKDCYLHQHVHVPTRFRGNQKSTLDLIFTREEDDVKNIEVIQPLGKSDHGIVVFDFICEWKANSIFIPKRLYHKGNYVEMTRLLN